MGFRLSEQQVQNFKKFFAWREQELKDMINLQKTEEVQVGTYMGSH